jgi:hypothetical protein
MLTHERDMLFQILLKQSKKKRILIKRARLKKTGKLDRKKRQERKGYRNKEKVNYENKRKTHRKGNKNEKRRRGDFICLIIYSKCGYERTDPKLLLHLS